MTTKQKIQFLQKRLDLLDWMLNEYKYQESRYADYSDLPLATTLDDYIASRENLKIKKTVTLYLLRKFKSDLATV